jgi:hypothetical protein
VPAPMIVPVGVGLEEAIRGLAPST